jgi:hypothetical protein
LIDAEGVEETRADAETREGPSFTGRPFREIDATATAFGHTGGNRGIRLRV